jgi:hypothetical protein
MMGLDTPYTPQIIIDGAKEVKIGDAQAVERVFQQAVVSPKVPVHISSVSVDPKNPGLLHAHVNADAATIKHGADIYLAVALDRVESQVLHGENGGRRLTHVAVVQQIEKIGKLKKGDAFAQDVQLKLKTDTPLDNLRVVAFAQESGPGKVLGASLWKSAR